MVARAFTVAGTHSSIPTVRKMTAGTSGTETGLHVGSYGSINGKYIGAHELVRISHDSATSKTTVRYKEDANHTATLLNRFTFSDLVITNIGGTSYSQTFNFQDDNTLDSVTESSNEIIFVFNVNTAFVNTNDYRVEFVPRKGKGDCYIQPAVNTGRTLQSRTFKGYHIAYSSHSKLGNISSGGASSLDARLTVDTLETLRTQLPVESFNYGYLIKAVLFMDSTSSTSLDRVILCLETNGDYTQNYGVSEVSGFNSMTIGSTTYNQSDRLQGVGNVSFTNTGDFLPGDYVIEWDASGGDPFGANASVRVTFT